MREPTPQTLLSVIYAKCIFCCAGSRREVERCRVLDCPLHPYRCAKVLKSEDKPADPLDGQTDMFEMLNHGG